MDYIEFYSDRQFFPDMVRPAAAMTKAELVKALEKFPDDLPVFVCNGSKSIALHSAPTIKHEKG